MVSFCQFLHLVIAPSPFSLGYSHKNKGQLFSFSPELYKKLFQIVSKKYLKTELPNTCF